jgi:serine/threonine protein kinase
MAESDGYPKIIMSGTDPNLPDDFTNEFSKYSNFKPLAHGGKAQLHVCWDGIMGHSVAVKSLLPELAQTEYERRRFLREARVTAQMQHPNTPPVYEIGRKDDGSLFFTMKLLAGQKQYQIVERLQNHDPEATAFYTADRLMEIVNQSCQALAYAHAHGVIHRDIKPENIWVGRFGEVLVLDWGVAKVWGQPDEPSDLISNPDEEQPELKKPEEENSLQTLTRSGVRPGTPLYMSPEQVLGHKYVDERTDMFSVGVVMYELLTLKLPFYGKSIRDTFDLIINQRPKRPTHAAPFREIPASLEQIVMKALEKEQNDRFQSTEELIDAIRVARRDLKS